MMGSYWKRVTSRAWRQSLELVRLESWKRIVVFLIGLLIPAFAAWYITGDSVTNGVRVLATLGGAFIGAAMMFAWNLIKLPAVMNAEAEAEREKVAAQLETQERRAERREALGKALASANIIADRFCSNAADIDAVKAERDVWRDQCAELAEQYLDGAHHALLWSNTGIVIGEPMLSPDRMGGWRWITYRAIRLQQIIASLPG